MKRLIHCIAIVQLIMLSVGAAAQFQPAPVIKSQERTMLNGKIYYIHTVQKGQTAYSISKAYEVNLEDLKAANPEVDILHLPEGLAIKIPAAKPTQAPVYPDNRQDFYAHTIKKKETIYSIARKYDLEEDVIYHYNPWARDGIKTDQTLWIPRKKEMYDISKTARANDPFFYYTVKEKDTLYAIARFYGVTVSDLVDANPVLRNGLKNGQELKIPKPQEQNLSLPQTDSVPENQAPCSPSDPSYVFNVALMLPFYADYVPSDTDSPNDSTEEGSLITQQRQQGLKGGVSAEFYEGLLLAVDSMKKSRMSVNLHVFDTGRDTLKTKRILQQLNQIQPDLIIGPAFSNDVAITGRFARYQSVPLVSPLSTRSTLVENNQQILQVIPSRHSESYAMANYLKKFKKGRIILIRGKDSTSLKSSWVFKKYLLENMPVDESGNPLYFRDYRLSDSLFNHLGQILSKEEENLLVVFSDREAEVTLLITRLIQRASMNPVILFGMPSWQSWPAIDLTYLHTLQLHLISPFYIDYNDPAVKQFIRKSRLQYGYEPFERSSIGFNYAMLGYDIGLYFLAALQQYGKNFMPCIGQVHTNQLLTRYHFVKTPSGGYINNTFTVIHYKSDFSVEKEEFVSGEPVVPSTIPRDTSAPVLQAPLP